MTRSSGAFANTTSSVARSLAGGDRGQRCTPRPASARGKPVALRVEQRGRTSSSVYGLHHRGRRAMLAELERLDSVPLTARTRLAVAA